MNAVAKVTQVHAAPAKFTMALWHSVRHMLLEAIERLDGTHTEEDVVALLLAGQAGLWIGKSCAAVTTIGHDGRIKELNVFLAGGDMDGLVAMKDALEQHGRGQGCERVLIRGRKGWERVHPDYRLMHVAICKDL